MVDFPDIPAILLLPGAGPMLPSNWLDSWSHMLLVGREIDLRILLFGALTTGFEE